MHTAVGINLFINQMTLQPSVNNEHFMLSIEHYGDSNGYW